MDNNARSFPLYVTRPIAPDIEMLTERIQKIVKSGQYTNFGPEEKALTKKMRDRWNTDEVVLFNNGTSALHLGLLALKRRGVIITTPFTFPATAHAAVFAGFEVRFADIDPETYNISVYSIADLIDKDVVAILGVHVFGNPCDLESISAICKAAGLYEIYDAAHCVDVFVDDKSVFTYGDFSIASFHATKLLHCGEGGALFSADKALIDKVRLLMNFGIENEFSVPYLGLNGKMSEFSAAVGSAVFDAVQQEIDIRSKVNLLYMERLSRIDYVSFPWFSPNVRKNYQYFPIRIRRTSSLDRDIVFDKLRAMNIYARKYFFPLLNSLPMYGGSTGSTPTAKSVSCEILCLPIHSGVTEEDVECICNVISG